MPSIDCTDALPVIIREDCGCSDGVVGVGRRWAEADGVNSWNGVVLQLLRHSECFHCSFHHQVWRSS